MLMYNGIYEGDIDSGLINNNYSNCNPSCNAEFDIDSKSHLNSNDALIRIRNGF